MAVSAGDKKKTGSSTAEADASGRRLWPGCYQVELLTKRVGTWKDSRELVGWLESKVQRIDGRWLLAFADDGVIWGRLENGRLKLSSDVAADVSPPLRLETLQELRLFGEEAELLLWKDGKGRWRVRVLRDADHAGDADTPCWRFDEDQILWGTEGQKVGNSGFTLMTDGEQGMRHAVPIDAAGQWSVETRPLRLTVRHYVQPDADGLARVVASRLIEIYKQEKNHAQEDSEPSEAQES